MYNFTLIENEEIIKIFDEILVKQGSNQKKTSIILTNKRILFFDFIDDEINELLRTGRATSYMRNKEVYFEINLSDITKLEEKEYYIVYLKSENYFEFIDDELFNLLKNIRN